MHMWASQHGGCTTERGLTLPKVRNLKLQV